MPCDQNQIVDHSSDSSALDRAVADGHIIAFHCCCSDDTQNIVSDHREFQNQSVGFKFSAGQALDTHIRFDLTVILLADSVIMIGRKNWLFNNTERGAKCSALLYSIISTAQANGMDVEKYLTDLFSNPAGTILLPWNN